MHSSTNQHWDTAPSTMLQMSLTYFLPLTKLRTSTHSLFVLQNATKLQLPTLPSVMLKTIVHLQSVSHNYTQSPTDSHNTINLYSPTICLSQRYKAPLAHSVLHHATNSTNSLYVLQNATNLHSPTLSSIILQNIIYLLPVCHNATKCHRLPLTSLQTSSHLLSVSHNAKKIYWLPVTTLQTSSHLLFVSHNAKNFTDCLSHRYKLSLTRVKV